MARASLNELATQLSRSNLMNREVQSLLHDRLILERNRMAGTSLELSGFLDAAAILLRSMHCLEGTDAQDVKDMIARLVGLVSGSASREGSSEGPADEFAAADQGIQTLNDMALGDVLLQLGLVKADDVERALERMVSTGARLGETLVELGLVSIQDVEQGLRLQRALAQAAAHRPSEPERERPNAVHAILLGEILLRLGKIDRLELEQALELQREEGLRLGDALVELGAITWNDVADALRLQGKHGGSSDRGASMTLVRFDD